MTVHPAHDDHYEALPPSPAAGGRAPLPPRLLPLQTQDKHTDQEPKPCFSQCPNPVS
ncbi:Abc transporter c family member 2, partial [Globisporangium polare]